MKKILSVLALILLCAALFACNKGKGDGGDSNTTETIHYDYTEEGFVLIKAHSDTNNRIHEERVFGIDGTLGIFTPQIIAEYVWDGGKLVSSTARYVSHSFHAKPETVLYLSASDNADFQYKICNAGGETMAYYNEELNENETVMKELYYTAGGRLLREVAYDIGENGKLIRATAKDGAGEKLYVCNYNESSNISTAEFYEGENTTYFTAEYYENGLIKSYTETCKDKDGGYVYAPRTTEFNEQGLVKKTHDDKRASYGASGNVTSVTIGNVTSVTIGYKTYKFDENGNVISCENRSNAAKIVTTTYTYDDKGRLTGETSKQGENLRSSIIYSYEDSGAYTKTLKNQKSVVTKKIFYDASGNITREEIYSSSKLSTYTDHQYDSLGRLTKSESYSGTVLLGSLKYSYNIHGDIVKETATGAYGEFNNKYEYFENGKLKKFTSLSASNRKEQEIEYFEDESYTVTVYNGSEYASCTYDKNGTVTAEEVFSGGVKTTCRYEYHENGKKSVITVYKNGKITENGTYRDDEKPLEITILNANGSIEKTIYEYYDNGKTKTVTSYIDDTLTSCTKYLESGNIAEMMVTDENGSRVVSKYVRVNETPKRIDTFVDGELAYYTLLEYFTYTSDEVNDPKSIHIYDKDGTLISITEYDKITVQKAPGYAYLLVKEEVYSGGELIAYAYYEYSNVNGSLAKLTEGIGDTYTVTEYNTNTSLSVGAMVRQERYSGGKLASVFYLMTNVSPEQYAEEFYGENGKPEYRYVYDAYSETLKVSEVYTFEYDENGILKLEKRYKYGNPNILIEQKEYSEAGILLRLEGYSVTSGEYTSKYVKEYSESGKLLRYLSYRNKQSINETEPDFRLEREETYSYHESGKEKTNLVVSYSTYSGNVQSSSFYEYDENGYIIHAWDKNGNGDFTSEKIARYNENGERVFYEYYSYGELSEKETFEYNENGGITKYTYFRYGILTEKVYEYGTHGFVSEQRTYTDSVLTERVEYIYHKNGELNVKTRYDGEGNVLETTYYNEYGEIIPQS